MVWRLVTKRVEPRALRVMNGRGRVGMKGRPAGWKAGPEHGGEPSSADCERYEQRRARAASACGERVRRPRVCGERVRRASGAQGHAGERASERERPWRRYLLMKEDFGWISRTWRVL